MGTLLQKSDIAFSTELSYLGPRYRDVVRKFLYSKVPDYFWTMPASTTGKYHPSYSLGDGGLVRHVKATIKIAVDLINLNQYTFNDRERNTVLTALLLHDCFKCGLNNEEYTVSDHPVICAKELASFLKEVKILNIFEALSLCMCIATHMGQWSKDRDGKVVNPVPITKLQRFVHLCDYLASRKFLEVNFDK